MSDLKPATCPDSPGACECAPGTGCRQPAVERQDRTIAVDWLEALARFENKAKNASSSEEDKAALAELQRLRGLLRRAEKELKRRGVPSLWELPGE